LYSLEERAPVVPPHVAVADESRFGFELARECSTPQQRWLRCAALFVADLQEAL